MSFTKLTYDDCSYKSVLGQNVSALSYVMDPIRNEHCSKCRHEVGIVGGTAVSHVAGNLVDLESNLIGIDREASKCPTMKYLPEVKQASGADFYRPVCTNKIDTNMKHLQPCQMHSVMGTPHPPPMSAYKCPLK